MLKKMLASFTAAALVLSAGAVLPEGAVSLGSQIEASAETYKGYEYTVLDDGTVEISKYTGNDTKVTIPSAIGGKKVTSIGKNAFSDRTDITGIIIPNGVTVIYDKAFMGCTSLTNVKISDSVTTIYNEAFRGCTALKSLTIPDSVTFIANYVFYDCTSLSSIKLSNSITSLGVKAFYGCTSLKSITIPKGVKFIYERAFDSCSDLKSVTIPNTVTFIDNYVFIDCSSLESITIPASVIYIYRSPFENCSSLKSINVSADNTCFSSVDGVLYNKDKTQLICCPCKKTKLTMPNTVTEIGKEACYACTELTEVRLSRKLKTIGNYAFASCINLKEIKIPDSVTTIGGSAFYNCDSLIEVIVPYGVTSIYAGAFAWSLRLETVTIPSTVTTIGENVFEGCAGIIIKCEVHSTAGEYVRRNVLDHEYIEDHIHKYTAKIVRPTYTSKGYTLYTCECGESYKDNYTPKLPRKSIAKAGITGLKNRYYTGKAIVQTPVVKLNGKTLKAGTNYTVSYKNNKAIGTATVTITGKGAYEGTVKATFKICPKKTTLKKATSPKTKKLKVTYSKVKGVTGYQVTFSTSKKFTKKTTKSVNAKGTSTTISKLKKGKTYYVKVRTYKTVNGNKYYSGYSKVKKVKVK